MTKGQRMARKARKMSNKLTAKERAELLKKGMEVIERGKWSKFADSFEDPTKP